MKCQCCSHIKNSQLICAANHLNVFYMRATLAFNRLMLEIQEGHNTHNDEVRFLSNIHDGPFLPK